MCSGRSLATDGAYRERSGRTTPKTVEDEAWWTFWVEDEGDIRHGVSAARRPAPATGVGVLDRAVDVLDAVEDGARSFTAIAEATGLTKPTAHRMITALQAHGFLMHVGGVGYALGPRLLTLATTAMRELPLRQLARPALEQLARTTGEIRAALRAPRRHQDLRRCGRVRQRAAHLRADRCFLAARSRVCGQGVPRMGSDPPTRTSRTSASRSPRPVVAGGPTATASASPASRPSAPRSSARTITCSRRSRSRVHALASPPCRPSATVRRSSRRRSRSSGYLGGARGGATRRRPRAPVRPGPGTSCPAPRARRRTSGSAARASNRAAAPRCGDR